MTDILLSARQLTQSFKEDPAGPPVLRGIDLDIYGRDFTVIMGPSGAGKSTLLYALSGMDRISGGRVTYRGEEISGFSEQRMAALRADEFGFVFQQTHLVSNLTLFENVAVAGYLDRKKTKPQADEKAAALLARMNVDHAKDRLPFQTSGGEAQRAAVARAVINDPGLVFADEPTGALNRKSSDQVLDLLSSLHRSNQSILMVTHDLRAAIRGNRLLYLEDGKILDELSLPPFEPGTEKEREQEVSQWLSNLSW